MTDNQQGATMERTAEEWGRVAVALPGWRWMPGMSIPENDCNAAAMIWGPGGATVYDDDRGHLDHGEVDEDYDYPDPDDPATAGCLLAILSPECHRVTTGIERDEAWSWWDGSAWRGIPTLGRACIAAAEALGRWPGGGQ